MVDEGFLWNGDDASDDVPYVREVKGKKLVILPRVNFPTNDLIVWMRPANPPSAMISAGTAMRRAEKGFLSGRRITMGLRYRGARYAQSQRSAAGGVAVAGFTAMHRLS
jgi:hypothetical protein